MKLIVIVANLSKIAGGLGVDKMRLQMASFAGKEEFRDIEI